MLVLSRLQRDGTIDTAIRRELVDVHNVRPSLSPMRALAFLDSPRMLMLMQGWAASMSTAVPADEKHPPLLPPWWTVAGKRLRVGFIAASGRRTAP